MVIQWDLCSFTNSKLISIDIFPNTRAILLSLPKSTVPLVSWKIKPLQKKMLSNKLIVMIESWFSFKDSTVMRIFWSKPMTQSKILNLKLTTEKLNITSLRKQMLITRKLCSLRSITRVKFFKDKTKYRQLLAKLVQMMH